MDGTPFTVLGVMPAQFEFPGQGDFWTPMVLTNDRSNAMDQVIARLKPNISLARATEDVTIIQHRWTSSRKSSTPSSEATTNTTVARQTLRAF